MRRTRTSRIRLVRKIWADCVPSSPTLSRDSCPGKSGTAFLFSLVVPVIHWPFLHFGLHSGGHFRCTESVLQGPLNGCLAGEGIRWDTAALLASTTLKCTGAASEPLKTATTGDKTVVLVADFYRQGDGNVESFTAKMVVSENDIAPDIPGIQTVWIQGVGCGTGIANFN